jgi:lysophospholipase L1-like esterase
MLTVYTFGDSILDCGGYNEFGLTPGQLIVRNNDELFPEFKGHDLCSREPARIEHRARSGSTVRDLPGQARGLTIETPSVALLTIGGNDLIDGLITDPGPGFAAFEAALDNFLRQLPIRPVLVGNVYDPTFGDDTAGFLGWDPVFARVSHQRMNATLAEIAGRYGALVDLHAQFLTGDPTWFVSVIEPSLRGASEVRRSFLPYVLAP